ncbi:hypothetical protein STEG23_033169 [Scotinomys teguina]
MGAAAAEANRTLFVCNLETKWRRSSSSSCSAGGASYKDQSEFSPSGQSYAHTFIQSPSSQWRQNALSLQRKRQSSHPYLADRHYSHEQRYSDHGSDYHYRGGREDFYYDDRNHNDCSHDYDNRRDSSRGGKWPSPRH